MLLAPAVVINGVRWLVPALCMVAPSPLIFCLIQILQLVKPALGNKTFEFIDEVIWSSFQRTVLCFFSNMNGTKAVFSGDYKEFFNTKENVLVISNHQTNVDWICMNMLTLRAKAMGKHGCINVGRHGSFKESKTVYQLNYLRNCNIPTWLVIFPEGTRYNPDKPTVLAKSKQFASNNGLPLLEHALSPRYRGTFLALRELHNHVQSVYDITIAYESTRHLSRDGQYERIQAPGMVEFIQSYSPKLHINIKKIKVADIPHTDKLALTRWLHSCYERKDRMMAKFMEKGKFVEGDTHYEPVTSWAQTLPYSCLFLSITALTLWHPYGRRSYIVATSLGGLAGIVWMKFH
ncbi:1-acyl-sn-glycerol-3-phosphate acyltransferase epsilon-like isoform X2 [Watersipora subatra]|uniref:1-acyl-sn-glycerol-3-phosphate acyltransferase epsilon-like isoform X2 n=1 Tax=Watersipora subatra TaxID=2589382 RepID=UPI00355C1CBA